jgi:hypothetical protein
MPEILEAQEGPDALDRKNALDSAFSALRWHVARAAEGALTVIVPLADMRVMLACAVIRAKRGGSAFLPGEPTFIIRAKDNRWEAAFSALAAAGVYMIEPTVWTRFSAWRAEHVDACKEPD